MQTHIEGIYAGVPFTGLVDSVSQRPMFNDREVVQYFITLDAPIMVRNEERTSILVELFADTGDSLDGPATDLY